MTPIRTVAAAVFVVTAGGLAAAQVSEIAGKVLDTDGKPVVGAEVSATNKTFEQRVFKSTTDKKGNYFVTGLLYENTADNWRIAIKAAGFVPVSVSTVARDSTQSLYLKDDVKLTAAKPSTDLKVRAFSTIRMDFTMRPGDAEAEAAPPPAIPGIAPAGAAGAARSGGGGPYDQALDKVRAGDVEGSVDLFKSAIEEKPDDWERHDVYAKVLLKLDRSGEATIQANKAVALAPDKAAPLITLTDVYLARSLPDKAAESIKKAEAIEPENDKVLARAAAVAADAGHLDEAIALNEKVLAKKPDNTEVLVALAALYNRNKQPKKAEEALNKVVAIDPANAHRTFYNLGVVIENRDDISDADHKKAIEAFRKAIELKPDYAIAHRDLGLALLRVGDLMAARKSLQKYVDLQPQAKDAADIRATVKSLDSAK